MSTSLDNELIIRSVEEYVLAGVHYNVNFRVSLPRCKDGIVICLLICGRAGLMQRRMAGIPYTSSYVSCGLAHVDDARTYLLWYVRWSVEHKVLHTEKRIRPVEDANHVYYETLRSKPLLVN